MSRRAKDYWTIENVIIELKEFITQYPEFKKDSSPKFLVEKKRDKLKRAIYKYGGLRNLSNKFNLKLNIKHRPWSEEDVLMELEKINKSGIRINQKNLSELGRNDLLGAISKYGSLNSFKEKIGLPIKRHKYWSEEKIIDQLKPIVEEFGRLPSEPIFKCLGEYDLYTALKKRGGVKKFAFLLNTSSIGYYRSLDGHYLQSSYECLFDNILFKYGIKHEVHGKLSNDYQYRFDFKIRNTFIEIAGYNEIEHPEYHRRLKVKLEVYKKMNKRYLIVPKSVFTQSIRKVEENVLSLLEGVLSVKPFSDSYPKVDIKPLVYWADIENIKKDLLPLVEKYERMPLDRELRKENKSSLIQGIYRFHGSLFELGELLNIPVLHKPKGYYVERSAVEEYKQLSIKAGYFLTQKDLHQGRYYGLVEYISKHGGYYKIRELTGLLFTSKRLPCGYYTYEKAQNEYQNLCLEAGKFLSSKELTKINKSSLANYIQTNGGYLKIRETIELNFPARRKSNNRIIINH